MSYLLAKVEAKCHDAVCNPQIHPDISRGSRLRVADVHRGGGAVGFRDRSGNLLPGHMLQECKL